MSLSIEQLHEEIDKMNMLLPDGEMTTNVTEIKLKVKSDPYGRATHLLFLVTDNEQLGLFE